MTDRTGASLVQQQAPWEMVVGCCARRTYRPDARGVSGPPKPVEFPDQCTGTIFAVSPTDQAKRRIGDCLGMLRMPREPEHDRNWRQDRKPIAHREHLTQGLLTPHHAREVVTGVLAQRFELRRSGQSTSNNKAPPRQWASCLHGRRCSSCISSTMLRGDNRTISAKATLRQESQPNQTRHHRASGDGRRGAERSRGSEPRCEWARDFDPSNLKIINTLAVPIGVQTPRRFTLDACHRLQHRFPASSRRFNSQLKLMKNLIDSNHGIYRGENPEPGKDVHGELDPWPGIREQPGSWSCQDTRKPALRISRDGHALPVDCALIAAEGLNAHDVHHAGEVVGEHMQGHLRRDARHRFH